jgi:replicative superfamily II helicase
VQSSAAHLSDLLAATALLRYIEDGDGEFNESCRTFALERSDGLLLSVTDFMSTYFEATQRADLSSNLQAADPRFQEEPLKTYIVRKSIQTLFPAQLRAIEQGALESGSRLIALPTSSGKTLLAELRIALELTRNPGTYALYLAPYRLLARQVDQQMRHGLQSLQFRVADFGAAFDTDRLESLVARDDSSGGGHFEAQVAVMTPERLDALMRLADSDRQGADEARELLEHLSILVFDEMQLIGRSGRGPRFEVLLARIRTRYPDVALFGLSAAAYGVEDLARWVESPSPITGARRPTGTIEVLWRKDGSMIQRLPRAPARVTDMPRTNKAVTDAAKLLLGFRSEYFPLLGIESTRPRAESLAREVFRQAPATGARWRDGLSEPDRTRLLRAVEEVHSLLGVGHSLGELILNGVAYHHAGVPTHILRLIEDLTQRKILRVLCATTTVAEGADLPFRIVVIPHLDFESASGRLERDLYLNIIGRAGRAGVAAEGLVFILDSNARTLDGIVRGSLWADTQVDRVRSELPAITSIPRSLADYGALRDLQSQILAWISEARASAIDIPARSIEEWFASRTLSELTATARERRQVRSTIANVLEELERFNLIQIGTETVATTPLGESVRLAGLSPVSCLRIVRAVTTGPSAWIDDLVNCSELSGDASRSLSDLLMQTEEMVAESLWLRRTQSDQRMRLALIQDLSIGAQPWPEEDGVFAIDKAILANWIEGSSYSEIADLVPLGGRANALFGGTDPLKRASDAAEQIGRITYPASWAYGAMKNLLPNGNSLPGWIRTAVESGTPSETAATLVSDHQMTRAGAIAVGNYLPSDWSQGYAALHELPQSEFDPVPLTALDRERLAAAMDRSSL